VVSEVFGDALLCSGLVVIDGDVNPLAVKRGEWPHLGLQTMQERAEAAGGTFEVESTPGKGTKVRICIPNPMSLRSGRDEP